LIIKYKVVPNVTVVSKVIMLDATILAHVHFFRKPIIDTIVAVVTTIDLNGKFESLFSN